MCVAVMGKVLSLDDKTAVIEYKGARIKARRDFVDISAGDLVMVHAGCVMQKITREDAEIMAQMLDDTSEN